MPPPIHPSRRTKASRSRCRRLSGATAGCDGVDPADAAARNQSGQSALTGIPNCSAFRKWPRLPPWPRNARSWRASPRPRNAGSRRASPKPRRGTSSSQRRAYPGIPTGRPTSRLPRDELRMAGRIYLDSGSSKPRSILKAPARVELRSLYCHGRRRSTRNAATNSKRVIPERTRLH